MIANYIATERASSTKVKFDDIPVSGCRLRLQMFYNRSRRFALYREAVSSLYTFGYGLFRDLYLAFGERFAQRERIAETEDIFFLYAEEVRQICRKLSRRQMSIICARIETRKHDIEAVRDARITQHYLRRRGAAAGVENRHRFSRRADLARTVHRPSLRCYADCKTSKRCATATCWWFLIPTSDGRHCMREQVRL